MGPVVAARGVHKTYRGGTDVPALRGIDLASLGAAGGDRLTLALPTGPYEITVGGVLPSEGAGAYGLRPAVHAPLEALGPLTAGKQVNLVRVSAVGDVRAGADASPAARATLERRWSRRRRVSRCARSRPPSSRGPPRAPLGSGPCSGG